MKVVISILGAIGFSLALIGISGIAGSIETETGLIQSAVCLLVGCGLVGVAINYEENHYFDN